MILRSRSSLLALAFVGLAGCGGGHSHESGATASAAGPLVTIAWPARTRDLSAPVSASVASITLYYGQGAGENVSQTVARPTGAAAVVTTTTLSLPVKPGRCLLYVTFAAGADSISTPVATAAVNVQVKSDGTLTKTDGTALGTVAFTSILKTVSLVTGQTIATGATADLAVTALDANNNVIALPAGSVGFAVTDGAAYLRTNADGSFTGLALGIASVTATVDGLTSAAAPVTITVAPLAARTVAAANSAFVYDPTRGAFWLAVPPTDPNGNSVRRLDPATGTLGTPIFVGADPSAVALSDDGSTLYAGLRGAYAVRRVDLNAGTAGFQFSLPTSGTNVIDLAVQPSHPGTVAATLLGANGFETQGPTVFDDGVARPNHLGSGEGTRLLWAAVDRIVAVNGDFNGSTDAYLAGVDDSGATKLLDVQGGVTGGGASVVLAGGRLYDVRGDIADATTFVRVGSFAIPATEFGDTSFIGPAIDVTANRAYFIQFSSRVASIVTFRLDTFLQVASRPLPNVTIDYAYYQPTDRHVFRWGATGLAFSLGDRIVLIDDVSGL